MLSFLCIGTKQPDLPPLDCTGDVCELPPKPLPKLEIVKLLDEWEVSCGKELIVIGFEKRGNFAHLYFFQ